MDNHNFKILSASAGTGKTYRLTKEYLKMVLSSKNFSTSRNLLALTFTNKAVGEMKERILENLFAFGQDNIPQKNQALFNSIAVELDLSSEMLKKKAARVLKGILHNYAFFDILTIDGFNHRLIRTFARDFQLNQNFEVELDTKYILNLAINLVLNKTGNDPKLTQVLIDFALEKIEGNRSWDISYDLSEIGKLLFNENHYEHLAKIQDKEVDEFLLLKGKLDEQIEILDESIIEKASAALKKIDELGFDFTDFNRETIPNHFKKIIGGERDQKLYNNKIEKNLLANRSIVKAAVNKDTAPLCTHLVPLYQKIKQYIYKQQFLARCKKNAIPLALISEIAKEINTIKSERNIIPIIEFNRLIANEIKKQPIPFIYERLGERYHNYFVDEFQDTSRMQWSNLTPLIGNALESQDLNETKGSLFLVGDVKQAIYRWRGGEAQQFLDLILEKDNPFSVPVSVELLDKNWRSFDQIINFNNAFFSFCSEELDNADYQKLYVEGNRQEHNTKNGGVVTISFVENEKNTPQEVNPHCSKVLDHINEITSHGYPLSTICLLVRKNDHGVLLADFLTNNEMPVISQDALLLKNNPEVLFLTTFLQYLESPEEKAYRFDILEFLYKDQENIHDFVTQNIVDLDNYFLEWHNLDISKLQQLGLVDMLESLIFHFDLVPHSNSYVSFFIDFVFEFEQRFGKSLSEFLDYWNLKKDTLSISTEPNDDAIQIMSIHKSKGLEFPFVIFPFADTIINDSKKKDDIWFDTEPDSFGDFEEFLVKSNLFMPYYSTKAEKAYVLEEEKSELDDFNVLYVTLTRAIYGLYIIASPSSKTSKTKSYNNLFQEFIEVQSISSSKENSYTLGEMENDLVFSSQQNPAIAIPYIYGQDNSLGFTVAERSIWEDNAKASIEFGNLVHHVMSTINYDEDLPQAIDSITANSALSSPEKQKLEKAVSEIVTHPHLQPFFTKNYDVFTEKEIIDIDGKIHRPDRLMVKDGKTSIIDYKTGIPSQSNEHQIKTYGKVLEKMGFVVENKILAYINEKVTILSV